MDWKGRKVLVTGGASFIGSRLVDSLIGRGVDIRVVDNLSSGRIENVKEYVERGTSMIRTAHGPAIFGHLST